MLSICYHNFVIIYIFLYINISTYITTGNREGFEHWAKLNNLKEAAKTFNYLSENNLLNYEDFQQHISDVENSIKATEHRIEEIGNKMGFSKERIRQIENIALRKLKEKQQVHHLKEYLN